MNLHVPNVTRFGEVVIGGLVNVPGNGLQLSPADTGSNPSISAIGDDSNISVDIRAKVGGAAVSRLIANAVAKTIVDGAATALFNVACPTGTMVGGHIDFLVRANDATDFQALAGRATYAAVNKAGTITATITNLTTTDAKAVSAGTITLAWTVAENPAETLEVRLQPTGSLTETAYTITYNVTPLNGAVTVL